MAGQEESAQSKAQTDDDYYNPVFERIGDRTSLLPGAIAYALYKVAKREWIQEFKRVNGRRPTDEDHRQHSATQTDAVLNAYVARADQILGEYAQNVIKDVRPTIVEETLKGNFSRSFWPSFWASLAFTGVLLILVMIAAFLGFGFPVQITLPRG